MTNQTTIQTIDHLGFLKAQIAELERQEKVLKARLGDLPPGAYEGEVFRLTVSETVRKTLDAEAIKAEMSELWVDLHSKETEVRTLRVSARNGNKVAA